MRKILIATGEYFGSRLARELGGDYDVHLCSDGDTALRLLEQLRPEGLVLQLDLGLEVLERAAYRPPVILVITPLVSDIVLQELQKQGVAYIFTTPCKVSSVVKTLKMLVIEPTQLEGGI